MSPPSPNGWLKVIVGALLVPAITAIVALVLLYGRVGAAEHELDKKADQAVVAAQNAEVLRRLERIENALSRSR